MIHNSGNSNVLLFDGHLCPAAAESDTDPSCRTLPSTRLYPGADVTVPIDRPDDSVIFKERRSLSTQPVVTRF